jgi:hypothetical protein
MNLKKLQLWYCDLTDSQFSLLGSTPSLQRSLESLELDYQRVTKESFRSISMLNLSHLKIFYGELEKGDIASIGETTPLSKSLKALDLSHRNTLGKEDVARMSTMGLSNLTLYACGLMPGDLEPIGEDCALKESVVSLDVGWNKIGKEDIVAISKLGLTTLSLSNCGLKFADLEPLLAGKIRDSLVDLDCRMNVLSDIDILRFCWVKNLNIEESYRRSSGERLYSEIQGDN